MKFKMSNPEEQSKLSMRAGVLVLKGIQRFLAGNHSGANSQLTVKPKGRRKMSDKENSMKCPLKVIEMAKRETNFKRHEVEELYKVYRTLISMNRTKINNTGMSSIIGKPTIVQEGIDRTVFREILHNTFDIVTENMLMDRIFCVWDKSNCGAITLESWLCGLNLFLRGSPSKMIEFCFSVYDLNADGFITKDEMFQLLRNSLIKHPQEEDPEESVKDFVDIILRKLDKDKDGKISLQDYQDTVAEEPLLLEAFGNCLPSEASKNTFLMTLKA